MTKHQDANGFSSVFFVEKDPFRLPESHVGIPENHPTEDLNATAIAAQTKVFVDEEDYSADTIYVSRNSARGIMLFLKTHGLEKTVAKYDLRPEWIEQIQNEICEKEFFLFGRMKDVQ